MLLERHFNPKRPVNIHELSVEAPERATFNIQREFEALKKSPFYNKEEDRWHLGIDSEQKPVQGIAAGRCATEFLALRVEFAFDKESSQQHFAELKETLYDKDMQRWESEFSLIGVNQHPHRWLARDQLLSVLLEINFDKELAQKRYRSLKGALFDKEAQRWYSDWYKFPGSAESIRQTPSSYNELLAVLIESFFDKEEAKRRYEELKESIFYVKKDKQSFWSWNVSINGDRDVYAFCASEELMGILALAQFDKKAAKKEYEALKETKLFDQERKQWTILESTISDSFGSNNTNRSSHTQLLDLLVQDALTDNEHAFDSKTPPIPESKKF